MFLRELKARVPVAPNAVEGTVASPVGTKTRGDAAGAETDTGASGGGSHRADYRSGGYWEQRYVDRANEARFEWLASWDNSADMREALLDVCRGQSRACHVGCGNSDMGVQIVRSCQGLHMVNVDVSATVVERMRERFPKEIWVARDLLNFAPDEELVAGSFDVVLDKGTLDALLCGGSSNEKRDVTSRLLEGCARLLRPAGTCVIVSLGAPEVRRRQFQESTTLLQLERVRTLQAYREANGTDSKVRTLCYAYMLTRVSDNL